MLLRKKHLTGRTLDCTPHLHAPLQSAHLPILKATGVLSLQELEDRLGFKPGIVFKQLLHIVPDIYERIWPRPPAHRRRQLAWQPAQAPVLPRRLRVHPCLGRRNLLAFLCLYQRKQPPNLLVRDQSASVPMNRNTLGLLSLVGNFVCRRSVVLIVARHSQPHSGAPHGPGCASTEQRNLNMSTHAAIEEQICDY